MLYPLDALSLHELIDLAAREGLILEAPACQECETLGLRIAREDHVVRMRIPQAITLLRRMLRVHYSDPIIIKPPPDLIM